MENDPLFSVKMPEKWNRIAFFWRGLCFGFLAGYLCSSLWLKNVFSFEPFPSVIVTIVTMFLAALPSLPKAWIEQRNRNRAASEGTLLDEAERGKQ